VSKTAYARSWKPAKWQIPTLTGFSSTARRCARDWQRCACIGIMPQTSFHLLKLASVVTDATLDFG
jgi:hypothetical protein